MVWKTLMEEMGLWFDFPTPFKKGDILSRRSKYSGIDSTPFIFYDLITWDCPERIRMKGDTTDMCAGYIGDNNGIRKDYKRNN